MKMPTVCPFPRPPRALRALSPSLSPLPQLTRTLESSTQLAYFNILEAGMVIIAVNLPSLWYYVNNVTPKSVLRSVRSFLSLGSQRTTSHNSTQLDSKPTLVKVNKSGQSVYTNSSASDLVDGDGAKGQVEVFALADLEAGRLEGRVIRVERSLEMREEHV